MLQGEMFVNVPAGVCCMCGLGGWKQMSIHKLFGSRNFQTDTTNSSTGIGEKTPCQFSFWNRTNFNVKASKWVSEMLNNNNNNNNKNNQPNSQTAKNLLEWGHQVWLLSKNRSILLDWNWAVCLWDSRPAARRARSCVSFCWSQQTIWWLKIAKMKSTEKVWPRAWKDARNSCDGNSSREASAECWCHAGRMHVMHWLHRLWLKNQQLEDWQMSSSAQEVYHRIISNQFIY